MCTLPGYSNFKKQKSKTNVQILPTGKRSPRKPCLRSALENLHLFLLCSVYVSNSQRVCWIAQRIFYEQQRRVKLTTKILWYKRQGFDEIKIIHAAYVTAKQSLIHAKINGRSGFKNVSYTNISVSRSLFTILNGSL